MSKVLETNKSYVASQQVLQKRAERCGTLSLTNDQRALALGVWFDHNGQVRINGKHGTHSNIALSAIVNQPKSLRNGSTRLVRVR